MEVITLLQETTPALMIEAKYHRAKLICANIWDKPDNSMFEDIFHDTIYKCLVALGNRKFSQDYMKCYFFKAFRINMIRHYGYSYNKMNSGLEIEDAILPIEYSISDNIDTHIDGFKMLDFVEKKHGGEARQMLWDNLSGIPYSELDKQYRTNTFYFLSKLKDELKRYYKKHYKYNKTLI